MKSSLRYLIILKSHEVIFVDEEKMHEVWFMQLMMSMQNPAWMMMEKIIHLLTVTK